MLSDLLGQARPLFAPAFSAWGLPVTWLEIAAFALSLGTVFCEMRVHVLSWPLAMASSMLYALLFAEARLYGEGSLQLFFVAMAAWGWWQWARGRDSGGQALVVRRLGERAARRVALATLAGWPLLGWLLRLGTDSDLPFLDALPTVGSIAGTFLLGRKFIANWPTWIAVNAFSVGLFIYKQLWLTALLYAVFAALSVAGWRSWRRLEGAAHA